MPGENASTNRAYSSDDIELGLDCPITRRDFLNSTVIGAGAALLWQVPPLAARNPTSSPEWFDGYSGVGDYAGANGNTWDVVQAAHGMRDGLHRSSSDVVDTGELYDVVVVGGGFAGMGAAHRVQQLGSGKTSCLVLENHPMWGGEARRNEFDVDGVRLLAPQGSNECVIPAQDESSVANELWNDLRLPREVAYSELSAGRDRKSVV